MKTTIAFLLMIASFAAAETSSYFGYGDLHAMGGYPMVGLGVRVQEGFQGMDFSANICPLNPPKSLRLFQIRGLYLYYPKRVGFYCGGGLGLLNEPETLKHLSGSLEAVIGYEWKIARTIPIFLAVNGTVPFSHPYVVGRVWPGLTFGLGF